MFSFILLIQGIDSGAYVVWKPAESLASLDAWEVAVKKRVVGVSLEQVLVEMGYDTELAAEMAANESSLTDLSQNTNTNNVLLQQGVTNGTADTTTI
jgi:hypothetical protein